MSMLPTDEEIHSSTVEALERATRRIADLEEAVMIAKNTISETQFKYQALLYRFARHLRNTDEIPLTKWSVESMNLLAKLQAIDPKRYEDEVVSLPSPKPKPENKSDTELGHQSDQRHQVKCHKCGCAGAYAPTQQQAAGTWNADFVKSVTTQNFGELKEVLQQCHNALRIVLPIDWNYREELLVNIERLIELCN